MKLAKATGDQKSQDISGGFCAVVPKLISKVTAGNKQPLLQLSCFISCLKKLQDLKCLKRVWKSLLQGMKDSLCPPGLSCCGISWAASLQL